MIVNLTPHELVFYGPDGTTVAGRVPSAGVARAKATVTPVGSVDLGGFSVPLVESAYGEPVGLPAPVDGVNLVVSLVTAQAARAAGRETADLLLLQELVRDGEGHVIGARSVSRL